MISLDWKERFKQDIQYFFEKKIPNKDYAIELIYNAYPQRIDNKVPKAVVTFVAKNLATKLAKKPKQYIEFYDFLWEKDDENSVLAFAEFLGKALKKEPEYFWEYLLKKLNECQNHAYWQLVIEKALYPFLKTDATNYLKEVFEQIKTKELDIKNDLTKLLLKLIKNQTLNLKDVFEMYEALWLTADEDMQKASAVFLKAVFKLDSNFYKKVFSSYKTTREPAFAEVLANAICCYTDDIDYAVTEWEKSGNVRLKKAGKTGVKAIKRYKNKIKRT